MNKLNTERRNQTTGMRSRNGSQRSASRTDTDRRDASQSGEQPQKSHHGTPRRAHRDPAECQRGESTHQRDAPDREGREPHPDEGSIAAEQGEEEPWRLAANLSTGFSVVRCARESRASGVRIPVRSCGEYVKSNSFSRGEVRIRRGRGAPGDGFGRGHRPGRRARRSRSTEGRARPRSPPCRYRRPWS